MNAMNAFVIGKFSPDSFVRFVPEVVQYVEESVLIVISQLTVFYFRTAQTSPPAWHTEIVSFASLEVVVVLIV